MDDSAPPLPIVPACDGPKRRFGRRAVVGTCAAVMIFAATEYLAAALLRHHPYAIELPVSLLALVGLTVVLLAAGAGVFVWRHWRSPLGRMLGAIEEARAGRLPVEQFPQEMGGLSPLAAVAREMFRDARRQRAEIAGLELEMQRRVESRTDALQRMISRLNAQATRDALTGLFNRRMLDQSLDELVARCVADREPLCLMMVDVDDFKLLNDTLGHAAGDALLRSVGQLVRSSVREQDLAFRCGGDEFVIVLPAAGLAEGESLAKRLVALVDALVKTLPLKRRPRLSIGMSTLNSLDDGVTGKKLMEEADRRLYAVKAERKGGRDAGGRAA